MENWTEEQILDWINKTTRDNRDDKVHSYLVWNAKDKHADVIKCRSCGIGILRNFAVSFANFQDGWSNYVDPEATYYHRNCWRVKKRTERSKITDVSPMPKWDALRSWFAGEEAARESTIAAQERSEVPLSTPGVENTTEDIERLKENAAVFRLADKDWQDSGWGK